MKRLILAVLVMSVFLLGACAPIPTPLQNTVDAIHSLKRGLDIPDNLMQKDPVKTGEEFDVNEYFSVLTHLSMQSGYILDWVYYQDFMGGEPVIYAREVDQTPYLTYSEYKDVEGDISLRESQRRVIDWIQVDGTAEGFFELIVFFIMGNQFYLFWHANYNDTIIICDHTGLEKVLTALDWGLSLPSDDERKARSLDFQPVIEFKDDTVVVKIVTFTKWGGFIRKSYTISREFPHRILEEESKTLVKYEIDIVF